jgi:hypothetical protein
LALDNNEGGKKSPKNYQDQKAQLAELQEE